MSIHLKNKPIKLPFSVSSTAYGSRAAQTKCGICHGSQSKYICPRCNIAYCSLACFRSESHAQCSEPFYQSSVRDAIAADPAASAAEKRKMMEMLGRFEKGQVELDDEMGIREIGAEAAEGNEHEHEDEDEETAALKAALGDLDLDALDSNDLFRLLPDAHRQKFMALVRAPESDEARELLSLAGQDTGNAEAGPSRLRGEPWFDAVLSDQLEDGEEDHAAAVERDFGALNTDYLDDIRPPANSAQLLQYNVLAVCLVYIQALRSHGLEALAFGQTDTSLDLAVRAYFADALPWLFAAQSTQRCTTVREAWQVAAAAPAPSPAPSDPDEQTVLPSMHTLLDFIRPSLDLARPSRVFWIMLDMRHFFARKKSRAAAKKLGFYASVVQGMDRQTWMRLDWEVEEELEALEEELGSEEEEEEKTGVEDKLRVVSP